MFFGLGIGPFIVGGSTRKREDAEPETFHDLSPIEAGGLILAFVFVVVCWVFFRAQDFATATVMLERMAFVQGGGAETYLERMINFDLLGSLAGDVRRPGQEPRGRDAAREAPRRQAPLARA